MPAQPSVRDHAANIGPPCAAGTPRALRLAFSLHSMIEGLKQKLQEEVERLNHEISFVLPKEIEKARAHGDLRENSEYKAALERQQFAQARVHHLRLRLSKLSDVREQDIPRDCVGFGSRVTVEDLDTKKKEVYALTLGEFVEGEDGDGQEMSVSMASPLGRA